MHLIEITSDNDEVISDFDDIVDGWFNDYVKKKSARSLQFMPPSHSNLHYLQINLNYRNVKKNLKNSVIQRGNSYF